MQADENEKYHVEGDHIGASPHVFDEGALPSSREMGAAIEDVDNVSAHFLRGSCQAV